MNGQHLKEGQGSVKTHPYFYRGSQVLWGTTAIGPLNYSHFITDSLGGMLEAVWSVITLCGMTWTHRIGLLKASRALHSLVG